MEKHAIYQSSWNTGPTGPFGLGIWIASYQEETEKFSYLSWKNGEREREHITVPEYRKIEQKDGMTRGSSPRNSKSETRYSYSIPM
jgi:hypothetical protein